MAADKSTTTPRKRKAAAAKQNKDFKDKGYFLRTQKSQGDKIPHFIIVDRFNPRDWVSHTTDSTPVVDLIKSKMSKQK